jgi:serine/threonine protein kinase
VKRVKLPPSSTNFEAFERRVTCVLRYRGHEPCSSLSEHNNILRLLGYGWNYEQGDTTPCLVTELASEGTLRMYLSNRAISVQDRLELCGDVVWGLYEIHLCGICHGDVKLDNFLVNYHANREGGRGNGPPEPVAKISDFGHSITLTSDQASVSHYRGTVGYAPSETYSSDTKYLNVDIRKCDLWALGLACWEILANGVPYYETLIVQEASSTTISTTASSQLAGTTLLSKGCTGIEYRLGDLRRLYELNGQFSLLV